MPIHNHMKLLRIALTVTVALSSVACTDMIKNIFKSPTEPTKSDEVRSYLGTWTGPATATPVGQTCGGLLWKITSQTGGQASGEFSATCGDGLADWYAWLHEQRSLTVAGHVASLIQVP